MGAPALAPRGAPARRAPARGSGARRRPRSSAPARRARSRAPRAAAAPRPNPALAGAALIPHAAVRTAGAVRDVSDSRLIVRLTAGRGWIGLLCVLLGGIVALNVVSLSINATSGRTSEAIERYERENSALRAELAEKLSASRVEDAAASLGLAVPAPEDVGYIEAREGDLGRLARLLAGDGWLGGPGFVPSATAAPGTVPASAPTAPAPTAAAPASAAAAPTVSAPAPAPAAPAASGGGATGGVGL